MCVYSVGYVLRHLYHLIHSRHWNSDLDVIVAFLNLLLFFLSLRRRRFKEEEETFFKSITGLTMCQPVLFLYISLITITSLMDD